MLISIALFVACSSGRDFTIEGAVTNADDGEMICLSYPVKRDGVWFKQRDTTYIHDGHFSFKGVVDGIVPAELTAQNMDFAQLFLEPSVIKFSAERSALYDYSLSGLSFGDDLSEYRNAFAEYNKTIYKKLYEVMRKNEEWSKAHDAGSSEADKLWNEFYALVLEHHAISDRWPDLVVEFVKSHPNNRLTPHVIGELARQKYDEQIIDSMANALSAEQVQSVLGEHMTLRREIVKLNSGQVGSKALDFTLKTIDGDRVTLSECYAKGYVLIDFWASWCHPCINEIPKVRGLHNKHGDRLQILSISVDDDITKWRDAVAQHNLKQWPQLITEPRSDGYEYYFAEQGDISLAYDVQQIPCFMLIDSNGVIIGRWTHITPQTTAEIELLITDSAK